MTEQQQPEPEQTDAEPQPEPHLVVHLVDGTVIHWPADQASYTAHEDGDLTIEHSNAKGIVAVFARGQWSACYDDRHLAS